MCVCVCVCVFVINQSIRFCYKSVQLYYEIYILQNCVLTAYDFATLFSKKYFLFECLVFVIIKH